MKSKYPDYLKLFLVMLLMGGCDLFENEQEIDKKIIDYGFEEGFFIYDLDLNKIPWTRDRNHLSLKFVDYVSEATIDSILLEFDLTIEDQVSPVKHYKVRCNLNPAEYYYSNNSEGKEMALKNSNLVEYSLPVFLNEFKRTILLTDIISLEFQNIDIDREINIIDSLIAKDNLELINNSFTSGQTYLLRTKKESEKNSLQLSNEYSLIKNVKFASPNYAFEIN